MTNPTYRALLRIAATCSLLGTCVLTQPEPDSDQFANQVATSVALTLTALPTIAPPTNTPLPTPTETVPPTPTFTMPAAVSPTTAATAKPDYACDIINQRPRDDTSFYRNEDFDIRWTIVNIGTHRWEDGTYLEYQSGPEMTEVTRVALPRLRPGEEYEVILDAAAPDELDRQIMVWAVHGPGAVKDSFYWMCYPYVRIMVEK